MGVIIIHRSTIPYFWLLEGAWHDIACAIINQNAISPSRVRALPQRPEAIAEVARHIGPNAHNFLDWRANEYSISGSGETARGVIAPMAYDPHALVCISYAINKLHGVIWNFPDAVPGRREHSKPWWKNGQLLNRCRQFVRIVSANSTHRGGGGFVGRAEFRDL